MAEWGHFVSFDAVGRVVELSSEDARLYLAPTPPRPPPPPVLLVTYVWEALAAMYQYATMEAASAAAGSTAYVWVCVGAMGRDNGDDRCCCRC